MKHQAIAILFKIPQPVPRHNEINENLARRISKNPPSKKVALNCTHWALNDGKITNSVL